MGAKKIDWLNDPDVEQYIEQSTSSIDYDCTQCDLLMLASFLLL